MSDAPCKQKALEIVNTYEKTNHGLLDKGLSSFDTCQILFEPELEELRIRIEYHINMFAKYLGIKEVYLSNNWFNVMEKDGIVKPHRHEGSVISGAYYIRAPEGSAKLHFVNPLIPFKMTEVYSFETEYNKTSQNVECLEDLMVLFPSWLEHFTDSNNGENRTVISFNTRLP